MKKDPIVRLVEHLKSQQGQFSDQEWETMDAEIIAAIESSVTYAKASPFPNPNAARDDLYAEQEAVR